MLVVAHTHLSPEDLRRWERAVPNAQFVTANSIASSHRLADGAVIGGLIVTDEALHHRGYARLSVLKAAHPEVAAIAYLDPRPDLTDALYTLGRAGCNAFVVRRTEDHPDHLRTAFTLAGARSVADVVNAACMPAPSLLAPANLERAVRGIARVHKVTALATAMGSRTASLRRVLRHARLPTPKRLLADLRLLAASRLLGDEAVSVERVGLMVGYSSGPAFPQRVSRSARHHTGADPERRRIGIRGPDLHVTCDGTAHGLAGTGCPVNHRGT